MDASAKQQVVERVKQAQNILVTVSTNPSVDQLASCIGLTLLLNKMGKHATAVFSGVVPSTLEFLQPEKTIERNTDSLRDFIISLDKEKADKLRYKVEDQVVKIFITPYRTSISEKDLVFSQGDYNVEVVMALGVKDKVQLDAAITAHGRILHDATVISVNAGNSKAPDLGQINWQEPTASSLSEMLVSISEAFGSSLIDGQMATAFLTGIVAETIRFSNAKTSPKVMTMSAQLMAAGANQQLIASKLEPPKPVAAPGAAAPPKPAAPVEQKSAGPPDGTLKVNHKAKDDQSAPKEEDSAEIHIDNDGNIVHQEETPAPPVLAEPAPEPPAEDEGAALIPPTEEAPPPEPVPEPPAEAPAAPPAEPAADTPKKSEVSSALPGSLPGSHSLLTPEMSPLMETAFTANTEPSWNTTGSTMAPDPLTDTPTGSQGFLTRGPSVNVPEPGASAPKVISNSVDNSSSVPETPHIDQARNAVDNAFASAPYSPELNPVAALNAMPLGDLHPPEAASDSSNSPDIAPAAPPPVPPPFMPSPGVVIPSQPYNPTPNTQQNNH